MCRQPPKTSGKAPFEKLIGATCTIVPLVVTMTAQLSFAAKMDRFHLWSAQWGGGESSVIVRTGCKSLGSPVLNAARMVQILRVALKSMEKLAAA